MLTLPTTIDNANLPDFQTDEEILRDDTGMMGWFTADNAYVAKSGSEITSFYDRFNEALALDAQGSSYRAELVEAAINGWAAARFNSDQSTVYDNYTTGDISIATGHAASFAWIGKFDTIGVNQAIGGRYASTTSRLVLQVTSGNKPRMLAENYYAEGAAAITSGVPMLLIGSFDGTSTVRLWQAGAITTGTTTGGDTASGNLILGTLQSSTFQAADMDLAEWLVFDRDILADADDAALAAIIRLASQVYGCAVG